MNFFSVHKHFEQSLEHDFYLNTHTNTNTRFVTLSVYLQRQQCVAVVVGAEHVVVAPGLRSQRSSGAWELGRRDDAPAAERLLHG